MNTTGSRAGRSTLRLIWVPALISLAVTVLRTLGEVFRWSERWFEPVTRGIIPSGVSWVFGITWLAGIFGIYFALSLAASGEGPSNVGRAVLWGLIGLGIALTGMMGLVPLLTRTYPLFQQNLLRYLVTIWSVMAVAAAPQWRAWPALFKTLLAYGIAARVPVVVVMFLAMHGEWGTHYDYVDVPVFQALPLMERFLKTAFFPQLIFWVAFTILLGSLCGSLALAARRGFGRN